MKDEKKFPFIEKNNTLVLADDFLEIYIPKLYFTNDLAYFMGRNVNTYGIFSFKAYNKNQLKSNIKLQTFAIPLMLSLEPNNFEELNLPEIDNEDKTFVLYFSKGETVISATELVINQAESFDKFLKIFSSGKLPKNIYYNEIPNLCLLLEEFNKRSLNIGSLGYEFIASNIYRKKGNTSIPFRKVAGKDPKFDMLNYETVNLRTLANINSEFTGIIFEDPHYAIQSAVNKSQKGISSEQSPIEKTIKY